MYIFRLHCNTHDIPIIIIKKVTTVLQEMIQVNNF